MAVAKVIYLSEETLRLCKLSGSKPMGELIRDAIVELVDKGGKGVVIDYPRSIPDKKVRVSDETHYLVNRLKLELNYETQDDLVFDVMVNYLIKRGLSEDCLVNILNLRL